VDGGNDSVRTRLCSASGPNYRASGRVRHSGEGTLFEVVATAEAATVSHAKDAVSPTAKIPQRGGPGWHPREVHCWRARQDSNLRFNWTHRALSARFGACRRSCWKSPLSGSARADHAEVRRHGRMRELRTVCVQSRVWRAHLRRRRPQLAARVGRSRRPLPLPPGSG